MYVPTKSTMSVASRTRSFASSCAGCEPAFAGGSDKENVLKMEPEKVTAGM
jgi:hypothetical protein